MYPTAMGLCGWVISAVYLLAVVEVVRVADVPLAVLESLGVSDW